MLLPLVVAAALYLPGIGRRLIYAGDEARYALLARTMVETMVLLAHKLRLTACAEGVETQEILDFLDSVGCDRAQGYFIGRPMPGNALEVCVRDWNGKQRAA